jgi:hypothetical protein
VRRLGLPEDSQVTTPAVEAEGEFGDLVALAPDGRLRGWLQLHLAKGWRGAQGHRRKVHGAPVYGIGIARAQGGHLSLEEIARYLEGAYCVLEEDGRRTATEFREFVIGLSR